MTPTERQRIEKEAIIKYGTPRGELHVGYIDGATAEHDKARNQAIQDCIDALNNTTGDQNVIPILETLKTNQLT